MKKSDRKLSMLCVWIVMQILENTWIFSATKLWCFSKLSYFFNCVIKSNQPIRVLNAGVCALPFGTKASSSTFSTGVAHRDTVFRLWAFRWWAILPLICGDVVEEVNSCHNAIHCLLLASWPISLIWRETVDCYTEITENWKHRKSRIIINYSTFHGYVLVMETRWTVKTCLHLDLLQWVS